MSRAVEEPKKRVLDEEEPELIDYDRLDSKVDPSDHKLIDINHLPNDLQAKVRFGEYRDDFLGLPVFFFGSSGCNLEKLKYSPKWQRHMCISIIWVGSPPVWGPKYWNFGNEVIKKLILD